MPDFSRRADTLEMMDDDSVDYETFYGCLADLAQVNILTLAHRPTFGFLNRLARQGCWPQNRPLEILDVGCGYGDALRQIGRWAEQRGLRVSLTGLDRNPFSARSAETEPSVVPIRWLSEDLFDYSGGADVVLSSQFTHHLNDALLVRFLEWLEATARVGWFVNDLKRDPVAYYGFWTLSRLLRRHRFVCNDGPVSITRAFSRADWQALLAEAGITKARIEAWFPYRLCVSRVRT
jgi:SAM-dependent methyltransferase